MAELDRIVVFPEHIRQGIGTLLLNKVIRDEKRKGIKNIVVNAGKEETHAKRFYEKWFQTSKRSSCRSAVG